MSQQIPQAERWRSFVDSQQWERGNLDRASYWTFLRAGSLDIDPQEAIALVSDRINRAGAPLSPGKLNQQIRRAYKFSQSSKTPCDYQLYRARRPAFLPG
jgi:hypothetical protein